MKSKEELEKMFEDGFECGCSEAGYCPVYNKTMGKNLHSHCKGSSSHRDVFLRQRLTEFSKDAQRAYREGRQRNQLDAAIVNMQREGITLASDLKSKGLGDTVEKILGKIGITEEGLKAAFNIKDCGCSGRKKWLNKIFKYRGTNTDDLQQEEE